MDNMTTTAYHCGHSATLIVSNGVVIGAPPLCEFCAAQLVESFAQQTPDELRADLTPFIGPQLADTTVQFVMGAMFDRAVEDSV